MTETLMNTGVRASGERRPGYVGPPLSGVDVRLVDDDGNAIEDADDETIGEIHVRGPNLFLEYLNRPDATAEAMVDGWFRTGDLATRAPDGYIRIVGRRATDLIKSGGFKIGAGEIEGALLEHPGVKEAAVTGEPDPDLGERIVAWVVVREGESPSQDELAGHVADLLTPHKRPRVVRFVDELPRNEMGKVQKKRLDGMKVAGEHEFAPPREQVWDGAARTRRCSPRRCRARAGSCPTGPDEYAITRRRRGRVGEGHLRGRLRTHRQGGRRGVHGARDRQRAARLGHGRRADAAGRRRRRRALAYEADATVTGPLAGVGQRLMGAAARRTTEQFLARWTTASCAAAREQEAAGTSAGTRSSAPRRRRRPTRG